MNDPLLTRELVLRLETCEADYNEAKLRALEGDDGNVRGVEHAQLGGTRLFSIRSRRQNPSYNRAMCFSKEDLLQHQSTRWPRFLVIDAEGARQPCSGPAPTLQHSQDVTCWSARLSQAVPARGTWCGRGSGSRIPRSCSATFE